MSVLRKVPHIEELLGALTDGELATLKSVMNSSGVAKRLSLVDSNYLPTTEDKGIYGAMFELELGNVKNCIVVYNNTQFFILAYNRYQNIVVYDINITNKTFEKCNEECNVEELRRIVAEFDSAGGVSAWETAIKGKLLYSSTTNEVQCGVDFNVDGDVIVNEISNFQDTDGKQLFWVGTQAEFEALSEHTTGTIYFVQQTNNTVNIYRY